MTLSLDLPPCPDSPLGRLDARWRLAGLLLLAAAATALRTVPAALALLAAGLLLVALSRLPGGWYARRLGAAALVLVVFGVTLPFLIDPSGPGWSLGPLRISAAGVRLAVLLVCKGVTILNLVLVVLATAPLPTTLKAAHALRIPGLAVQLAMMTYRYVFVLADELARLRVALRVRGFRSGASRHGYRTLGRVTGTLLVRGYERAERVGQAMRCRAFDGRFRSLAEFRTRPADVAVFVLLTGGAAAALVGDSWLR
jgi:cobalt/nickel transport system permease protein